MFFWLVDSYSDYSDVVVNTFEQTLHSPVDTSKVYDLIGVLNVKHENVDVGLNPITFAYVVEGRE